MKNVRIKVSALLGQKKMSIQDLANATGLAYDTVRFLYHETAEDVMLSTLARVYEVLSLESWDDLLEFVPPTPSAPSPTETA